MELYKNDLAFEWANKTHDENRQGESLVKDRPLHIPSNGKKFYIESYGCAMNFSDSEIVASVLTEQGYDSTKNFEEADIVFINTCSIRDKAEQTVRNRLDNLKVIKKRNPGALIGVLGCMAERLKEKLVEEEKLVDIVAGPDAYRTLPALIQEATGGQKAVNVLLSRDETYGDISPVRLSSNGITAFVSITRGCDNMCAFCVVPYTRGRERSRHPDSIVHEAKDLASRGFKEITLLGQNVDSYRWSEDETIRGKKLIELKDTDHVFNFANLLERVAQEVPQMRIRYSTSHPKDMLDDVLHMMAKYDNICKHIHLPVQSGSSSCLERMNRTYDRAWYLDRIAAIRRIVPEATITTDIIAGFCGETEEEHQETLSLMKDVKFILSYMYYYSERPGTLAAKKYTDDVPLERKKRRLQEIVDLQRIHAHESNIEDIGKCFEVLIEGVSKKNEQQLFGRTSQSKVCVFDKGMHQIGDLVQVKVTSCTSGTLIAEVI
ncbi:MAG: tRNA (N6-isopentenyl adenosine(37)-C2)-methylthiotransferase MiaB [Bacteroidota bacterium]